MTNEELKKKIVDILNKIFTERDVIPVHTAPDGKKTALPDELCEIFNKIVVQAVIPYFADALIEAGYGDAQAAEHRAARAEMALLLACAKMVKDEKDDVNIELLVGVIYRKYLEQAEKELAEEGK